MGRCKNNFLLDIDYGKDKREDKLNAAFILFHEIKQKEILKKINVCVFPL
jgi:hypothetical protein